ncbi:hypothetical protein D9757_001039 [Collybiopsis confluens]|uniref:Zn(2)-C6 fungal-type domain-containing protein n=1 Tax=Collybiopsis confluens TaxID=2823264 RepID=A0A8H5MGF3_9AGAR|nr:hypothetical protein D9757_001039 [Collybiopsis confluens]
MRPAAASSSSQSTPTPSAVPQRKSCAECRRLKLKCDRVFPCAACIRRGCGNLCPTGTLEKGKRGFLKRLEQALPPKSSGTISENGEQTEVAMFISRDAAMTKRIQELEAALADAGIDIPGAPATRRKRPRSNSNKRAREKVNSSDGEGGNNAGAGGGGGGNVSDGSAGSEVNDVAVGFGTLTIDPQNRSRYIGMSSGSAYLDDVMWGSEWTSEQCTNGVNEEWLERDLHSQVLAKLSSFPPYEEALVLGHNYFTQLAFMYEVVPKENFFSNHLPTLYRGSLEQLSTQVLRDTVAMVAMVLSLGKFFDLKQPCKTVKGPAGELFRIAAFALNSHNIIDGGLRIDTIMGVQALHLMAMYNLLLKDEKGAESNWQLIGLGVRSMCAQGIHMDGSTWNLPARDVEERRRVFWEMLVYDGLQSFDVGRPHALSETHFDCKMPTTSDEPLPSDSDPLTKSWSYTQWHTYKFKWVLLLGRIKDNVFSVKPPTYATILQFDGEINDFYFSLPRWILCPHVTHPIEPATWKQLFPPGPDGKVRFEPYATKGFTGIGKPELQKQFTQSSSMATMIFMATLHMHRRPFCRALMAEPKKLLQSTYEPSIIKVISSSTAIINIARGMFVLYPCLTSRVWIFVFHAFSAAVCLAVFVIVAPFHPLAPRALHSLQCALEFFNLADNRSAQVAALRLTRLANKAKKSMASFNQAAVSQWHSKTEASDRVIKGIPMSMPRDGVGGSGSVHANVSRTGDGSTQTEREDEDRWGGSTADGQREGGAAPEEFLGASTKLVRLHEDPSISPPASSQAIELQQQPSDLKQSSSTTTAFAAPEDPFAQLMGLYDNSNLQSNLSLDQTAYIQQEYASLPQTSRAHAEMLPVLQSWIQGSLPEDTSNSAGASPGDTYSSASFSYSDAAAAPSSSSPSASSSPAMAAATSYNATVHQPWRDSFNYVNSNGVNPIGMGETIASSAAAAGNYHHAPLNRNFGEGVSHQHSHPRMMSNPNSNPNPVGLATAPYSQPHPHSGRMLPDDDEFTRMSDFVTAQHYHDHDRGRRSWTDYETLPHTGY